MFATQNRINTLTRAAIIAALYAALATDKQGKAAAFLHRADRMADRAGREMEHLRRAGKAALLGHGVKNPVFKQRHDASSRTRFNLFIHVFMRTHEKYFT